MSFQNRILLQLQVLHYQTDTKSKTFQLSRLSTSSTSTQLSDTRHNFKMENKSLLTDCRYRWLSQLQTCLGERYSKTPSVPLMLHMQRRISSHWMTMASTIPSPKPEWHQLLTTHSSMIEPTQTALSTTEFMAEMKNEWQKWRTHNRGALRARQNEHVETIGRPRYVVRWNSYGPWADSVRPLQHIPQHFKARYCSRLTRQKDQNG